MITYRMWDKTPGECSVEPALKYYPAGNKKTKSTAVIFPGGAYSTLADHEGGGYAEFFNSIGMDAFVCDYRVYPHRFPLTLLDARRAVRFVRAHADEFGIDPERIAVAGSSAGGHLAALLSTYTEKINFEDADGIDRESYMPNVTILCYPVIRCADRFVSEERMKVGEGIAHENSFKNLLGDRIADSEKFSPDLLVTENTPPAFLWCTSDDDAVSSVNTYLYASALSRFGIKHEVHTFREGSHGLGLAENSPHVAQWTTLLVNWLADIGFLPES